MLRPAATFNDEQNVTINNNNNTNLQIIHTRANEFNTRLLQFTCKFCILTVRTIQIFGFHILIHMRLYRI